LSKPVDRLEFLIGKFMGLALTLLVNIVLMGSMFLLSFALFKIRREGFAGAMDNSNPLVHPGLMFDLANMTKALVLQYASFWFCRRWL
jgi:ABC-type transport system involved in multi-copper enzyme maturation permease subunit